MLCTKIAGGKWGGGRGHKFFVTYRAGWGSKISGKTGGA